ncbi:hypothetical protein [Streptomyces sp. TRM68367]|uniref:hypothetical protein n=1 Tax=Streptomyces sp. TRM68367 TaxID=2758415 RepID=UPI00165C124F|nr:hypothetical protein [Streptomyces sp. TRM68367]MBC9727672.1 hypothetical protein [Streptomyces sp. TRM68367]
MTPGTPVAYRIGALTAEQIAASAPADVRRDLPRRTPGFLQALDVTAVTCQDAERLRRTARTLVRDTLYRDDLASWRP